MHSKKILICEDEGIVAQDIKQLLQKVGYQVVGLAGSMLETLSIMDKVSPDLVLMDIHLKGNVSGIELARIIEQRLHIPVIFLTAYGDAGTRERAQEADPAGFLVKPFDEVELHAAIELALEKQNAKFGKYPCINASKSDIEPKILYSR